MNIGRIHLLSYNDNMVGGNNDLKLHAAHGLTSPTILFPFNKKTVSVNVSRKSSGA
jgi:hypothetical protein